MDYVDHLTPKSILEEFQSHCTALRKSYSARKYAVVLRNVVEDKQDHETSSVEDMLGRRQPADVYNGDVNLRTLRLLLKMIDNRGWERQYNFYSHLTPTCLLTQHPIRVAVRIIKCSSTPRSSAASRASSTRTSGRLNDRPS